MPYLLIETSTERGVVALFEGTTLLIEKILPFGYNQSQHLMTELQACFSACQMQPKQLDYIGIGVGPGSYTGIRIGVAVAKGIAYACQIPLVGFSSLEGFIPNQAASFAALIDAKIGGAYVLVGKKEGKEVVYHSEPEVCPLEQLEERLKNISVLVTPSQKMIRPKIEKLYPNRQWEWEEREPDVLHLGSLVQQKYQKGEISLDGRMELLYLRKTEAEREKEKRN
jgi:tRNA threonylcarbamoyladenosine biosynthesis protein TsaB